MFLLKKQREVRREKGRIKDRMDLKTEGAVKAKSAKCQLKWTMRGQLLAPGGLSPGHQASHHRDANVTMATDRPRYTDQGQTLVCFLQAHDSLEAHCCSSPLLLSIFTVSPSPSYIPITMPTIAQMI